MTAEDGTDNVTLGEVYRSVQRIEAELGQLVSQPALDAELHLRDQRIHTLETAVRRMLSERDKWRMAIFATILVPIIMRVLELKGAG